MSLSAYKQRSSSMPNDKKIRVEFAPGAFDHFEGTQEELDEFVAEIRRMAESGELEEHSVPLDDEQAWDLLTEEEKAVIAEITQDLPTPKTRH